MKDEKQGNKIISEEIKRVIDNPDHSFDYFQDMTSSTFDFQQDSEFFQNKNQRKKQPWRTVGKAAAIILAIFVCSNILAVFYSEHNTVRAVKTRIEQFIWKLNGAEVIESDDGNGHKTYIFTIDDWDEIEQAKKLLAELYIPEYIPSGYEFIKLEMQMESTISYTTTYLFSNAEENLLIIGQTYANDSPNTLVHINDIEEKDECALGEIYLSYYSETNYMGGTILRDTELLNIIGEHLSKEEIIQIANGLIQ